MNGGDHDGGELRASLELNERIIEAMPGGIVHVGADGTIHRANDEALRILGLTFDEISRKYTQDFETETVWEDGSACLAEDYPVTRALVTGEPQPRATIGVRRPDGRISWAIFTAVPVKDRATGATTGAVVTFLDITDRKRDEERLLVSDRMASIGTLAAGVAHEINNPLTFVLGNLQRIERGLGDDNDELRVRVREAIDGADRIRKVVRELGVFAHSDEIELVPLHVSEVLDASLRIAENELRYRARLSRDYADVPKVLADRSRLGQVFLNLIVNAVQAIPAGHVEDNELSVATSTTPSGIVRVTIADTGSGIPAEIIDSVFEPFWTTKPAGTGNGLGLYISKNIVESLGGRIHVASNPGEGTSFSVDLLPATAVDATGRQHAVRAPRRARAGARILVVDDEPNILRFIGDVLEHHELTFAASGREAITALDRDAFDLMLCDLIMPDITGMDVYQHASDRLPGFSERVVFMTGAAFTPRARDLLRRVPNPVLQKPFDPQAVLDTIEPLLEAF